MNGPCFKVVCLLAGIQLISVVMWYYGQSGDNRALASEVTSFPECKTPELLVRTENDTQTNNITSTSVSDIPFIEDSVLDIVTLPDKEPPMPTEEFNWFVVDERTRLKCNDEKVSTFFTSYPEYATKRSKPKEKLGMTIQWENLGLAQKILNELHIPFFLSHGTLLGLFRECNIIGHTSDVDIGIPYKYMTQKEKIQEAMVKGGFKIDRKFGVLERGLETSFRRRNYNVDFFTFYKDIVRQDGSEQAVLWNSMWWENNLMRRMAFPVTEFMWADWGGRSFLVPKKSVEWLRLDYGETWNIPQDKWVWYTSPRNYLDETIIREISIPEEMERFGPNILKNPSFEEIDIESGLPKYWQPWNKGDCKISPDESVVHNGKRSLKFTTGTNSSCYLFQEFDVNQQNPEPLLLSGWSKKEKREESNMFTWSNAYAVYWEGYAMVKGKLRNIADLFGAEFGVQETKWQYSSYIINPGKNSLLKIKAIVRFEHYSGTVWFDEIALRKQLTCENGCNYNGKCIYGVCHCDLGFTGTLCDAPV